MRRQIVYPGQVPLETDMLNTNRNVMIALGKLAGALLGTGGLVNGLAVAPTQPASLSVQVGAGEIYQLQNVDNTAYSSIPLDTTDTCVKQGIQLQPANIAIAPPNIAGYSQCYLIEATFQENDINNVVLPYYNSSNPNQALNGPPGNPGQQQPTQRDGQVILQAKAGIAAATGTQVAPAVDPGYIALAVVTIANGQASITAANIAGVTANKLPSDLLHIIQQDAANYAVDIGSVNAYAVTYAPAISALVDGMPLSFRVLNTNTGASTLSVNGLPPQSVVTTGHKALFGGELNAGSIVTVVWNANASVFELQVSQSAGRLLRTTVYTIIGGVQQVSINGGAFTTVGASTFTSLAQTNSVIAEGVGGGGSGGGSPACTSAQATGGAGGGSGAYFKTLLTSGFSGGVPITIGSGGVGASGVSGTSGGTTSFGAIASAPGGGFGVSGSATSTFPQIVGYGAGGSQATGGNLISAAGSFGASAIALGISSAISGSGGSSVFGGGGSAKINNSAAGNAGPSPGSGGSGALTMASGAAQVGGNGAPGQIIVYEYA